MSVILALGGTTGAQPPEGGTGDGEKPEIVITYTREETPVEQVAGDIQVVTRKDIENMPAATAAEVLQNVPGVYVSFSGGPGSFATAGIQGSMERQVAVYQDGVPLNMLANPVANLSLLPSDIIERIEVYKGAASSAWGSAMGGVINIITREPTLSRPFSGELTGSCGDEQTYKGTAVVSGTVDRLGYYVSGSRNSSNGYMPYTDYSQDMVYGKLNYFLSPTSRINFACNYDAGQNADPTPNYPDFWDDVHQHRLYERLLFETQPLPGLSFSVESRHQDQDSTIWDVYSNHRELYNDYSERSWGTSARASYREGANLVGVGFDGDWGDYDFNQYARRFSSGTWGLYANDTYQLGKLTLNGGIRYDENIDFGSEVSPSGGAVYRLPWLDALVRFQVARGFSAPPGAWVTDPLHGNKNLQAETALNYQLGCELRPFRFLKLQAGLFQADVHNFIQFDYDRYRYENILDVTRRGFEVNLTATVTPFLNLGFGGTYVDVRNDQTGELMKNLPRTLLNTSVSYVWKQTTQSLVGRYVDNNSSYPETHDRVFVFDYLFKVRLPFPQVAGKDPVTLFAAVYDLTDARYLYRNSFPQPGRRVEGGVSFQF